MFKYSVGPWNVHEGADAYGPTTRESIALEEKLRQFKEIGFDAIQFHDDDAVLNMNELSEAEIIAEAKKVKALLDKYELKAEFVAPRLWMDPRTIDGGFEHLKTSLKVAKALEEKVNRYDYAYAEKCIAERNYEKLEMYVLELIMGLK